MKRFLIILFLGSFIFASEQKIVFGAGCFWGVEKFFEGLKGVKSATSGYAGGDYKNPTYKKVLSYRFDTKIKNHKEVVEVIYDDSKISTENLIKNFWELHDPTQGNRQGNDVGNNYASAIYYTTQEQKNIAFKTKEIYQKLLNKAGFGKITTEIAPLKRFYKAKEYHQDYLKKNPNGYCPNHRTGVKFEKETSIKHKTITPLGGKEIVIIEAKNCPFCKKFKDNVTSKYRGTIPLRYAYENELKGFYIKSKIIATPTILFIQDGKEVFRYTGYLSSKEFYKALGIFKLGKDSEAFNVAFNAATDAPFCKKYDKFKHTGDGVFIDRLSGDILFDTRDRFNSGSGWLSFYKPVGNSVIYKDDYSHGMHRVEVLARVSGVHLGHVFDDAPGGRKRFCINATVLEFVPRDKVKSIKNKLFLINSHYGKYRY